LEVRRVLLDTNAYVRLLAGDTNVLDEIAGAEEVHLSVFVMGELLAGFQAGNKFVRNRELLKTFLAKPTVSFLGASAETAEIFAQIKNALRKAGTPIPINDIWIAAHAMETGSVLITFDGHFRSIPGLRMWAWMPEESLKKI
jgi:tRNA(fMet)-specific endonuclease VapC